jgi:hypothetical protein
MKKLWRSTYKPTHAAQSSSSHKRAHGPDRSQLPAKSIRRDDNYRDSIIYNWNTDSEDEYEQHIVDEYDAYLQEKRLRFVKGKQMKWPNLTRFAFDALSIPAMSAECERCFSSGKNMISDS